MVEGRGVGVLESLKGYNEVDNWGSVWIGVDLRDGGCVVRSESRRGFGRS